jgi:hypothetical protein
MKRIRSGLAIFFTLSALALMASQPLHGDDTKTAKTVRVIVDYNDGAQKSFTGIAWKKGMTALDATLAASKHRRGFKFSHSGKGTSAFVSQIDDLKNEGSGKGKRNWLIWLNEKLARRGVGDQTLQPGDELKWKFSDKLP